MVLFKYYFSFWLKFFLCGICDFNSVGFGANCRLFFKVFAVFFDGESSKILQKFITKTSRINIVFSIEFARGLHFADPFKNLHGSASLHVFLTQSA